MSPDTVEPLEHDQFNSIDKLWLTESALKNREWKLNDTSYLMNNELPQQLFGFVREMSIFLRKYGFPTRSTASLAHGSRAFQEA